MLDCTHLLVDLNVELSDTLQGELLLLDEDANWLTHEALRHVQHISRHRGRQQDYLHTPYPHRHLLHTN